MELKEGQKILLTLDDGIQVKANIKFILSANDSIVVTYRNKERHLVYKPFKRDELQTVAVPFQKI